jgi:multidrug transporter EmrE-like cation transporter
MDIRLLLMILTCVSLAAFSQLVMKVGMTSPSVKLALASGQTMKTIVTIATNMHIVLGLGMYVAGAGLWLLVLSRADISVAYPFVGLGFVLTMLLGWMFLGEQVGLTRVVGTFLVVAGVYLIAAHQS